MKSKALEIRDTGTFIAVLAVDMNPTEEYQDYLLRRCGYACDGRPNVLVTRLDANGKASNDPYAWHNRTWRIAHNYIIEHWNELNNGDVIDVQFILGETTTKKLSERLSDFVVLQNTL